MSVAQAGRRSCSKAPPSPTPSRPALASSGISAVSAERAVRHAAQDGTARHRHPIGGIKSKGCVNLRGSALAPSGISAVSAERAVQHAESRSSDETEGTRICGTCRPTGAANRMDEGVRIRVTADVPAGIQRIARQENREDNGFRGVTRIGCGAGIFRPALSSRPRYSMSVAQAGRRSCSKAPPSPTPSRPALASSGISAVPAERAVRHAEFRSSGETEGLRAFQTAQFSFPQ